MGVCVVLHLLIIATLIVLRKGSAHRCHVSCKGCDVLFTGLQKITTQLNFNSCTRAGKSDSTKQLLHLGAMLCHAHALCNCPRHLMLWPSLMMLMTMSRSCIVCWGGASSAGAASSSAGATASSAGAASSAGDAAYPIAVAPHGGEHVCSPSCSWPALKAAKCSSVFGLSPLSQRMGLGEA